MKDAETAAKDSDGHFLTVLKDVSSDRNRALPIDRGWAWVTTGACAGLFAIASGTFKSLGVIMVELMEHFPEEDPSRILWIFTLGSFVLLSAGPVHSLIIRSLSHRRSAMLGIALMAVGLIGTGYSPNIWVMYFTHGIIYGFGSGLVFMVAFLATGQYFNKRKSLAVGLTASGGGVGTFIMPNLLRQLFDHLDFSGAMLLYAGVILNVMILACLLRPIEFYSRHPPARWQALTKHAADPASECVETDCQNDDDLLTSVNNLNNEKVIDTNYPECARAILQEKFGSQSVISQSTEQRRASSNHLRLSITILSDASLSASAVQLNMASGSAADADCCRVDTQPKVNWRLCLNSSCILLGFSVLIITLGNSVVFSCVPPLGQSRGVPKDTIAFALALGGVLEVVGRIVNGWFADKQVISTLTQYTVCVLLSATAALMCAIISGLPGISILLVGVAAFGTSVYSLIPMACVELFGRDNLPMTLGIQNVYQSFAYLMTTPVVGKLHSHFGAWEPVYYYVSICCYAGASLTGVYLLRGRCKQRMAIPSSTRGRTRCLTHCSSPVGSSQAA